MYTQRVRIKKRTFIYEISNPKNDLSSLLYNFDIKINDIQIDDADYVILTLSCKSQDALEIVCFQFGGAIGGVVS